MKRARDPDRFREAYQERGLTAREVGRLCGCSDGTVRFVMAGTKATNPSLARRIAKVLRQPLDVLFVDVAPRGRQDNTEQDAVA
ncbi:MAG: helix-turn-helix transcriptional regulator [Pseudonocardia sp.]|nr:helix-turn-helix transcriptional regulator [Pseudonocardia sp.]MDN5933454.1 helix-turn-helix transcriptional regulator [Pseudonocardia sp.]